MNQNLKNLILSEHSENNHLAVEILKRKWWVFNSRIPKIIRRIVINHYLIDEGYNGMKMSKLVESYWEFNPNWGRHWSEPVRKFKYKL